MLARHQLFCLRMGIVSLTLCMLAAAPGMTRAAETSGDQYWPAWRGPLASGVSPTADPPTNWDSNTNIKWKAELPGEGSASPIIWGDRIFIEAAINTGKKGQPAPPADLSASNRGGGRRGRGGFGGTPPSEVFQFTLLCIDRNSGKTLWQKVAREEVPHEGKRDNDGTFASPSPITDGKHVFAFFGSRGLYCYDMEGNQQWSADLGKMKILLGFGEGSSPALHGDSLVICWDNEEGSFITALDKNTGKTLWKTPRDERTTWATPLIVDVGGKLQVVTSATTKVRAYDLASGTQLWEGPPLTRNVIPSPVAGDGVVYCMSGFQGHLAVAIRLDKAPGGSDASDAVVWKYAKKTPYVASPLLYNGRLWFFADTNEFLTCLDAKTGQPIIDGQRIADMQGVYASPVAAAGRVYLTSRNGTVVVMKDGEKPALIATNHLEDKFDASPALAGGDLLLRGQHTLYCIAKK